MSETESLTGAVPAGVSRSPPSSRQLQRAPSSTPRRWKSFRPRSSSSSEEERDQPQLHSSDIEDSDPAWHTSRLSRIPLDLRARLAHLSTQEPRRRPLEPEQERSFGRTSPTEQSRPSRKSPKPTASTSSSTLVDHDSLAYTARHGPARPKMASSLLRSLSAVDSSLSTNAPQEDLSPDISAADRIHMTFDRVLRDSRTSPPNPQATRLRQSKRQTSGTETEREKTRLRDYYADSEFDLRDDDAVTVKPDQGSMSIGRTGQEKENRDMPVPEKQTPARSRLWRRSTTQNSPATPHLPGFLQSTPAKPNSAPLASTSTPKAPPPDQSLAKTPRFPGFYDRTTPAQNDTKGKGKERDTSPQLDKHAVGGISDYLKRVAFDPSSLAQHSDVQGGHAEIAASKVKQEDVKDEDHALSDEVASTLHARLRKRRSTSLQKASTEPPAVKESDSDEDGYFARLSKAEKEEQALQTRADEVKQAVEEVGARLSAKLTEAVGLTLRRDAKRRMRWLLFALLGEVLLLLFIFIVASARARQEYLSSYYDPFAPYLDPFPSSSESPSYVIPAETLLLFAPPSHNPSAQPSSLVDYVLEWAARLVVSSWASTAWDVDALEWVMPT